MFKHVRLILGIAAALLLTGTAMAQGINDVPLSAGAVRINFLPGTSTYSLTTTLTQGVSQSYVLGIAAQQSLYVAKNGNASVTVLGPQGNVLAGPNAQPGPWGVNAAETGDYILVLSGQDRVTLSLYVPAFDSPQFYSTIVPAYRPRIRFAPGASSTGFQVDLAQGYPAAFVLGITAQQRLSVAAQGIVTAAVLDPQDNVMQPLTPGPGQWQFTVPQTGDYTLLLLGTGRVLLSINIPPLGSPPPARRVQFDPGTDSTTITTDLTPGGQAYVLAIAAGQTLYISTTGGATFQVFDPQGTSLPPFNTPYGASGYSIPQDGDYTLVFYGQGQTNVTFYIPPLEAAACMPTTQRLSTPAGGTSMHVQGGPVSPGCSQSFVLLVNAGQNLGISFAGYNVFTGNVTVKDPSGNTLSGRGAAGTEYFSVTTTGDYTVTFDGAGQATFDVSVQP